MAGGQRQWIAGLVWAVLGSVLADSWTTYQEQPCCRPVSHHRVRHHRDHIREFACGNLFYRTLYINEERNTLYVGAMDRIFRLNMTDISQSHCERDALLLEASNVARCVSKGKSEPFECRNHIRVLQPLGDGERLYVCGTNAHSPKDWVVYLNLTHLPRHEYVPGVGLGVAKCPYDPADNSTAVWVTKGNPGGLPALYAGTNAEFTKADPVIFRNDLFDFRTGQKRFNFKRTLKYDSKWLDKTNFVGSFDVGDYVLFFFRETAVEFMNCGKAVYSRVARVCKQDTGGKHILSQNWATYLKARLNCSIPGEFPFYFDEIQSVYQMPGDPTKFYATFTTGASDGLVGSAICTYTMENIQEAFAGRFKEQATSSSAWLPVLRARVPEPRPGTCVNNTEALPDNVLNFIRSHPLMDAAVRHDGDSPAFYKRDLVLTTLVVDRQTVDMLADDITYPVFYAGTSAGEVYKIVQWAGGGSRVVDIWRAAGDEPVRALALSRQAHALYLATDNRLRQLPLRACAHRYDSCVRCVLDPYCGWDKEVGACRPYTLGLLHDATNSTPSICEASAPLKTVRAGYGQSVHLAAFGKTPEALRDQNVAWYHHSRERGRYKIIYNWERVLLTSERGLVLLSVTDSDRGRYECYFGPTLVASYNLDIDIHRCTQPNKSQEYRQVYSDWCHEFEKYKSAMKAWESRQMQCSKNMNSSSQQNTMSNEIVASLR
ncbi:semaphorin-2A-like isoform X1 [Colias croceus]|uniref:semaphorin-2A-like isoform X1 n=1 Tax=Colias crocea TaxID=72248 RepID=UPI001E2817F7|nr:semaphorin-2A-like isoform X1 [Colias croceus]